MSTMAKRILRIYDAATPQQVVQGSGWYQDARAFCVEVAGATPYSLEQVAYVCAVLSPQVTWEKNMEAVRLACAAGFDGTMQYGGYSANVRKAAQILQGDLTALRGPKVEAFAAAILGDLSHVVVDIWAIRAARSQQENIARVFTDDEMPGAKERRTVTEAYCVAARRRGVDPAVMQATTWTVLRESGKWSKPQTMPHRERETFWRRQGRARIALGMRAVSYQWKGHSDMKVAALTA